MISIYTHKDYDITNCRILTLACRILFVLIPYRHYGMRIPHPPNVLTSAGPSNALELGLLDSYGGERGNPRCWEL